MITTSTELEVLGSFSILGDDYQVGRYPYQQKAYITDKHIFLTCLCGDKKIEYLCDFSRGKPLEVTVHLSTVRLLKLLPESGADLESMAHRAINTVLRKLKKIKRDKTSCN